VYSSTGGEWPRGKATAEVDTNREHKQGTATVCHSSPWIATAMRARTYQMGGESASPQCTYPAEHMASVCRYTPVSCITGICVSMRPTISGIKAQHLGPVNSLEAKCLCECVTYLPHPRPHQS